LQTRLVALAMSHSPITAIDLMRELPPSLHQSVLDELSKIRTRQPWGQGALGRFLSLLRCEDSNGTDLIPRAAIVAWVGNMSKESLEECDRILALVQDDPEAALEIGERLRRSCPAQVAALWHRALGQALDRRAFPLVCRLFSSLRALLVEQCKANTDVERPLREMLQEIDRSRGKLFKSPIAGWILQQVVASPDQHIRDALKAIAEMTIAAGDQDLREPLGPTNQQVS
jgi:hypothetical protein